MQTIPIQLPPVFFYTFKTLCTKFLWHNKHPRIKYEHLVTPKSKGDIGLPDLHKYYRACLLTRIVDWNVHTSTKQWVDLEEYLTDIPLATAPWLSPKHIPSKATNHILIGPTLRSFHRTNSKQQLSTLPGPMTPLHIAMSKHLV